MNFGKGPRGFGLRDGLGPHRKRFINPSKLAGVAKNPVLSQTAKNIAVGTLTNLGVIVASKVVEKISDEQRSSSEKISNNKQDIIVVDAVKEDDGKE